MADCAIYILWNGREALMEDRPDLKPGSAHYWVYPGGKVEPDELPEVAAEREAWEEIGVELLVMHPLLDAHDFLYSQAVEGRPVDEVKRGWRNHPYLCTEWAGDPPSHSMDHNHAPFAWVDPAEIAGPDDGYTAVCAIARRLVALQLEQAA